jgi:hypothetical protein
MGGFFRYVGSQRAKNKMSAHDKRNLQFNFINYFIQFVDIFVLCQWLTPLVSLRTIIHKILYAENRTGGRSDCGKVAIIHA